jgi:hypothetical protein
MGFCAGNGGVPPARYTGTDGFLRAQGIVPYSWNCSNNVQMTLDCCHEIFSAVPSFIPNCMPSVSRSLTAIDGYVSIELRGKCIEEMMTCIISYWK